MFVQIFSLVFSVLGTGLFAENSEVRVLLIEKRWEEKVPSVQFETLVGGQKKTLSTKGTLIAKALEDVNIFEPSIDHFKNKHVPRFCNEPYDAPMMLKADGTEDSGFGAGRLLPIKETHHIKAPLSLRVSYTLKGSAIFRTLNVVCEETP